MLKQIPYKPNCVYPDNLQKKHRKGSKVDDFYITSVNSLCSSKQMMIFQFDLLPFNSFQIL